MTVIDRNRVRISTRLARFGTSFKNHEGVHDPRAESWPEEEVAESLFANEIAVDIGGACVGYQNEQRLIFDHYFAGRVGNFPSAAAAVLHLNQIVESWLQELPDDTPCLQIVTHQEPDFDALAAATIVEALVRQSVGVLPYEALGLSAEGWLPVGARAKKLNWFAPDNLGLIPDESRWLFWIAAVASLTDQCRRYRVPFHLRLPAYLAAATLRGRKIGRDEERRDFFQAIRQDIETGANPLADLLLESNFNYRWEAELLRRAPAAYARDLKRGRIAAVPVPVDQGFSERYRESLKNTPLIGEGGGQLTPGHLVAAASERWETVDGIYLRDPECPVFKDLARQDFEGSPTGKGFRFTAVANSNTYPEQRNASEYFFALDPEAVPHAHLYSLWALLQCEEIKTRKELGVTLDEEIRGDFEGRAVHAEGHFKDPWFDGANYGCTIVVSPGHGTVILPEGTASDLSDDGVAGIVRNHLERSPYAGDFATIDFPGIETRIYASENLVPPAPPNSFRFVSVPLARSLARVRQGMAMQIGKNLWQCLHAGTTDAIPDDFENRHLWWSTCSVGVWSRKGMAIATLPESAGFAKELRDTLSTVAQVSAAHSEKALEQTGTAALESMRQLLRSVAKVRWTAAHSACRLPARFLAAMDFDHQIELIHDLHATEAAGNSLDKIQQLQGHAAVIEVFIFSVYVVELAHMLSDGTHTVLPAWTFFYLLSALALALGSMLLGRWIGRRPPSRKIRNGKQFPWHFVPQMLAFLLVAGFGWILSHAAHEKVAELARQQTAVQEAEKQAQDRYTRELLQSIQSLQHAVAEIETKTPKAPVVTKPPPGKKGTTKQ